MPGMLRIVFGVNYGCTRGHEVNGDSGQGGLYNVVGTLLFPAQMRVSGGLTVSPGCWQKESGFADGLYYRNEMLTHIKKILQ